MPIDVTCAKCRYAFTAADAADGLLVPCPQCGARCHVGEDRGSSPAPEEAGPKPGRRKRVMSSWARGARWGLLLGLSLTVLLGPAGATFLLCAFVVSVAAVVDTIQNRRRVRGQVTAWACLVLSGAVLSALFLLATAVRRDNTMRVRRKVCSHRLAEVGKAMWTYSEQNGDYWPCDARGPLYSLALLYPDYIDAPDLLVCPAMGKDASHVFPPGCSLAGRPCSYAYDPEGAPDTMKPGSARMADVWGSHGEDGVNVLFWDGHVSFADTPYWSDDPEDNIYAPDPARGADADAWARQ